MSPIDLPKRPSRLNPDRDANPPPSLPNPVPDAPIFIPAKIWSHRKAKEALAASTVKIAARDVLATWKITYVSSLRL